MATTTSSSIKVNARSRTLQGSAIAVSGGVCGDGLSLLPKRATPAVNRRLIVLGLVGVVAPEMKNTLMLETITLRFAGGQAIFGSRGGWVLLLLSEFFEQRVEHVRLRCFEVQSRHVLGRSGFRNKPPLIPCREIFRFFVELLKTFLLLFFNKRRP